MKLHFILLYILCQAHEHTDCVEFLIFHSDTPPLFWRSKKLLQQYWWTLSHPWCIYVAVCLSGQPTQHPEWTGEPNGDNDRYTLECLILQTPANTHNIPVSFTVSTMRLVEFHATDTQKTQPQPIETPGFKDCWVLHG